jgi:leucine dehydrogenase
MLGESSSNDLFELAARWDGLGTVVRYDEPTGTWVFVALHDPTLGTPVGGCRMKVYEHPALGLQDAMRLAEGMTYKWAVLGLPFGGGKSVLAIPRPLEGAEREGLLIRFAGLLNSLNGSYGTGEDLGTTPEDMALLAAHTPHVAGGDPTTGNPTDPGPFTALGVLEGIRAAAEAVRGSGDLAGLRILVEGVGDVGRPLAEMLAAEGARVLTTDLDADASREVAMATSGEVVDLADAPDAECDVYAPCAVGGTLDEARIGRLRCSIVAGSANNQLATDADGRRLADRGILYAPDYVINGGGALAFGLMALGESDTAVLEDRVRGIGSTLRGIFEESAREGVLPEAAALALARRTLSEKGDS